MVEPRRPRWSGPALLRLYPTAWRQRYEPEMLDLLAERPITTTMAVDLARGAIDARLHPAHASAVPSVAALLAGAAWMVVVLGSLAEPVAPDWPGFLAWTLLPAAIGAAAGTVAAIGVALRLGNSPGRGISLLVAALAISGAGSAVALVVAAAGGPYGVGTAAVGQIAALATIGLGVVLGHRGQPIPGLAIVVVGGSLLLPPPGAWIIVAIAWTALGLWLWRERVGVLPRHAVP